MKQDTTAITSLALSYHTSPPTLITCHMSMTMRYYPLPSSLPLGSHPPTLSYTRALPKAHSAPILVSAISSDNTLLATGSSDGVVKVWDLEGGYVTHLFRGHGGPVSAVKFFFTTSTEGDKRMELYTGSTDGRVRIFDLKDSSARAGGAAKPKTVLEGHVSTVRGIDISEDGRWAVTAGRDKVVLVWDLSDSATAASASASTSKKGKSKAKESTQPRLIQTIICEEQIESLGLLPTDQAVVGATHPRIRCWTGGDKGLVRIWDVLKAELAASMRGVEGVDEAEAEEDEQRGIIQVL
jgi:U3 small nucleolar RNA-associated protein 13